MPSRVDVLVRLQSPFTGLFDNLVWRFVHGILPDTLLERYDFYRDETSVGKPEASNQHIVLRGYLIKSEIRETYEQDLLRDPDSSVIIVSGEPTV